MEEFDPAWFDLDPADVVAFESSSTQDLTQPCQSGSGTKSAALYLSEQIETPDAIGEGEDPVTNVYGSNISSLCSPNPQPRNVFGSPKISIDEYRSTEERRFSSLKCGTSHPARPTVSLKPKGLHSAWQHISAPAGPDAPSNAPPPNVPNSSKSGSSDDTTKGRTMIASRPIRPLASRLKLADWGLPKGTVDAYWQKGVKEVYPWQVFYICLLLFRGYACAFVILSKIQRWVVFPSEQRDCGRMSLKAVHHDRHPNTTKPHLTTCSIMISLVAG